MLVLFGCLTLIINIIFYITKYLKHNDIINNSLKFIIYIPLLVSSIFMYSYTIIKYFNEKLSTFIFAFNLLLIGYIIIDILEYKKINMKFIYLFKFIIVSATLFHLVMFIKLFI